MAEDRTEGWGSVSNAAKAHYFKADGTSLCRKWFALGHPRWESNQSLGDKPDKGTCAPCWKERAKQEGKTS